MEEKKMISDVEILNDAIKVISSLKFKVDQMEEMGIPLMHVRNNLRALRDAIEEKTEPVDLEEAMDGLEEAGTFRSAGNNDPVIETAQLREVKPDENGNLVVQESPIFDEPQKPASTVKELFRTGDDRAESEPEAPEKKDPAVRELGRKETAEPDEEPVAMEIPAGKDPKIRELVRNEQDGEVYATIQ